MAKQYGTDMARLHAMAAEARLRAVESQLSLGFTFCLMADTQIRHGHLDQALKVIARLRHHMEVIRLHLNEPGHLPKPAIPTLTKQLTELKERTEQIESRLSQT